MAIGPRCTTSGARCVGHERIRVSETTESLDAPQVTETGSASTATKSRRRGPGLTGMVLADLKTLAGELGIKGTSGMRKGDLVAAISAKQGGGSAAPAAASTPADTTSAATSNGRRRNGAATSNGHTAAAGSNGAEPQLPLTEVAPPVVDQPAPASTTPRSEASAPEATVNGADSAAPARTDERAERADADGRDDNPRNRRSRRNRRDRDRGDRTDNSEGTTDAGDRSTDGSADAGTDTRAEGGRSDNRDNRGENRSERQNDRGGDNRNDRQTDRGDTRNDRGDNRRNDRNDRDRNDRDDDEGDGRGRRGRRYRDRNRRGRDRFADNEPVGGGRDPEIREDDVLVPVAGILDVLDSYAFIRTSGYLTGPNDVYVSLSQVRKNGLRRGDAVTGAVRALRDGEQSRQKFNALVRLDTVNGLTPEEARQRPEFTKLTPLYPNERLRLETESHLLTTRVIDLVMPVGKGQRALIVSPPKAGKTMVMQAIANAIATNNPECHLMVVLVDERPEEVTDMQRSVKGEVIASTFDRPPADHTLVAELSIERAKRLVEMGKDVVVLLDSITRLGRAYNLAAPASGRILSGGVDSTALFPPKRFLGAARNIENGGSLTIFASALVETGSAGDTVIFEEFKGTGNAELKLDRRLADKRIFPAIDVDQSSTRKEDLLMSPDELAVVVKLRRLLAALDTQPALELVLDRLRKTRSNVEFLMQVAKNAPGGERD
ncbi:transcription termination factor Rho [Nakamurella flava]|uniref:Transcription termination factor Rho n=1 Tax=Nakamurella flava TaxID=2576308 RepID=A0A4U6QKP8_9ACTN|nr:transcription termination factor Rho [Nakamurella flava]